MRILRYSGALALVPLGLLHPAAQLLGRTTDFGCNRADRPILRAVLTLVVEHHPDRAFADLRRKGVLRFVMAPYSQEVEPPGNPEQFTAA